MSLRDELGQLGKQFYCVTFTVRSGSSLLCQDLQHWGFGDPAEWFQSHIYSGYRRQGAVSSYVQGLSECSPHRVVGFKITWGQACVLANSLRREGEPIGGVDLACIFPGLRWIHLTRRDKIQQAVSAWRAVATGKWHYAAGGERLTGGPRYDYKAIKDHYERILVEDALWDAHFERHQLSPLRLEYEAYTTSRRTALDELAAHLHAEPSRTSFAEHLQVMRDSWTDDIVDRFWVDMNKLVDTEPPGALVQSCRRLGTATRQLASKALAYRPGMGMAHASVPRREA